MEAAPGSEIEENAEVPGFTITITEESGEETEGPAVPGSHDSLLTKFWDSLHVWADITTLHGARFVFDPNSHIVRRAIWFIIMAGMLFLLVWNGQTQVNRYFKYKTLTIQTVQVHETLQFPSVTICSRHFIRNDSIINDTVRILIEELLQREPNKTRLVAIFGELYLNRTSFRELLMPSISKLDDFILSCTWKGLDLNCSEYFTGSLTENGLCYTISATQDMFDIAISGDTYGLEVVLWSGQDILLENEDTVYGIKVRVHEPSEEPNMELASLIGPGFLHYVAVTTHVYDYMQYPVQAFGGQYCIDSTSDAELHGHYSVTKCYRKCRQDFIRKTCGCLSPFDVEDAGDVDDCSVQKMIDCYRPTLLSFMSQIEKCHCPTPCHVTKYQTKQSSTYLPEITYKTRLGSLSTNTTIETLKENLIILKLFYESKEVIYHEQILEFTFEDLWASFGGYIGLAVGASFITFLEIVDLFAVNVYHHFRNIRHLVREPH